MTSYFINNIIHYLHIMVSHTHNKSKTEIRLAFLY